MKTIIKENTWLDRKWSDFGWGNGYVVIPKDHPLYGKECDEIHDLIPSLEVNGCLTFSENAARLDWPELEGIKEGWVVGFDTAHSWDSLDHWPKESVQYEADKLKVQIEAYKP